MNRLEKIDDKLDIVIEKLAKIEVILDHTQSELKSTKIKIESHERDINRVKGALALISMLGIVGAIKTYLHLN